MKKHKIKKAMLIALVGLMLLAGPASSSLAEVSPAAGGEALGVSSGETAAPAADGTVTKEEVIYARLDNQGGVAAVYVVNSFELAAPGTIVDYGRYSSAINLTTTDPLLIDGEKIQVAAPAGLFYYQGDLAEVTLPWRIHMEYQLNGATVEPASLAGASGPLAIRIRIESDESAAAGFADHFAVQVSLTLAGERCGGISAAKGTIANSGGDKIVTFVKLPGIDADYTINLQARDFEMPGITFSALPLRLDIATPDTGSLTGQFGDLEDGIVELDDGAQDLHGGAVDLSAGAGKLAGGLADMDQGIGRLLVGLSTLEAGSPSLRNGSAAILAALNQVSQAMVALDPAALDLTALADGSSDILAAISSLSGGLAQLSGSFSQTDAAIAGATGNLYSSLAQANTATIASLAATRTALQADPIANAAAIQQLDLLISLLTANNQLVGGLRLGITGDGSAANPGLAAGAAQLAAQYAVFDAAIQALPGNLANLAAGLGQLKTAVSALASEYAGFDGGVNDYLNGVAGIRQGLATLDSGFAKLAGGGADLKKGAAKLADGAGQLADGTNQLKTSTQGMADKVQTTIDDYLAGITDQDFAVVSFVSPLNTRIASVQFVLRTEGIQIDSQPEQPEVQTTTGVWERFLALFGL